jgi:ferrous iron transport protein A
MGDKMKKTLNELKTGDCAKIQSINFSGSIRRRLRDLGFVDGTKITALQKSPSGDPVAYLVRGTVIALRNDDAEKIQLY